MIKFRKIAIVLAAVMTFSGCSEKDVKTEPSELPPDIPYCRNIMETENGYYYNVAQTLSLRYTDKATGNDIFLCAKPECMHDGNDACTATYNNIKISEPVMYNGSIYFIGEINTQETLGYSLYKAAPDGSSLDKIADITEEKKPSKYQQGLISHNHFIIHKGYAYVFYCTGNSIYFDFIQSGFARVDIQTGETEILYKYDEYQKASHHTVIAGRGDYVFYYHHRTIPSSENILPIIRYNIITGESENLVAEENSGNMTLACFDDNSVYFTYFNTEKELTMLKEYDIETFEKKDVEINTGERAIISDILCYEDKFFFQGNSDIKVIDKKGKLLGKISVKALENIDYYSGKVMDISDDKLYITININESGSYAFRKEVYCCSIDDVLSGNAEWKKAYTRNNWTKYWDEDPVIKSLNEKISE